MKKDYTRDYNLTALAGGMSRERTRLLLRVSVEATHTRVMDCQAETEIRNSR